MSNIKEIKMIKTDALIPYARNARTHSSEQVMQIAASIKEFGFNNPILIREDFSVIAGHGRLAAAIKLGIEEVPTICLSHLTPTQVKAYILADNKLAMNAGWDEEMLALEIQELDLEGFDVSLAGFDAKEIEDLINRTEENLGDENEIPKEDVQVFSKQGEIWLLGNHRLMCGSSTNSPDVALLMNGKKAKVCLTDPPYGLKGHESAKNNYDIFNDTKENVEQIAKVWLPLAMEFSECVVFSSGVTRQWIYPEPNWVMCWFYGAGQARSSWGFNCWQPLLCYGKDPSLKYGHGCRPDSVNMNCPSNSSELDHPCPKPVNVWIWFIERLSFEIKDLFFEPFSGSGTTIIACEKTNRVCYAMELSPKYVDIAIKRWQDFTGKVATLESDGSAFPIPPKPTQPK
jgi:DNA modification methylase